MFVVTGIYLPYMPQWLKAQGLSSQAIAQVLAAPLILRLAGGPFLGLWAEGFPKFRTPVGLLGLIGTVACLMLIPAAHLQAGWLRVWALTLIWGLTILAQGSASPLVDAMAVQLGHRLGFAYDRPRAVGSAGFVAGNLGMGALIMIAPIDVVVVIMALSLALMTWGGFFGLGPYERRPNPEKEAVSQGGSVRFEAVIRLFRHPGYAGLILVLGLIQCGHGFYYGFSTLIWKGRGLSGLTCGALWATGVAAEILFMAVGEPIRRRMGPWRMVRIAASLGVVRWSLMALDPPLWALWPLQCLHAGSFAATYLAGLELVARACPKGLETLAQSVATALSSGVMLGLATLISGPLYAQFGPLGYGVMAGLVALGGIGAWLMTRRTGFRLV